MATSEGVYHMRCNECGNRVADGLNECRICHMAVLSLDSATLNTPIPVTGEPMVLSSAAVRNELQQDVSRQLALEQGTCTETTQVGASKASAYSASLQDWILGRRSVQGRVILVEPSYLENPSPDVCRFLNRTLWIILLVLSPVLVLYWILVKVGGFPALLAFIGMFLLVRFISPTNLYAMFRIFSVLNPATRDPAAQVPVRYYRIREDESDAEAMVRVKGRLTHGNIGLDDRVTLFGRLSRGTLFARHGYNHRTASTIRTAGSYSWVGLLLTLIFILVVANEFYQPTMRYAQIISSLGGVK